MQELLGKLNMLGIKLRAEGGELRISAPAGTLSEDLRDDLRLHKARLLQMLREGHRQADEPLPLLEADPARRFEPFPLTELQHAYWVGRDSAVEMGNVATQLYVELECRDMNMGRLNEALQHLIARHEMLRAVINADGTQRILPDVPAYCIAVSDQSAAQPAQIDEHIAIVRDTLLGQVRKAAQWPLFEIRATLLPVGRLRLHVSLDLLILDASSVFFFFREWHHLYTQPARSLPPIGVSFRDCIYAEQRYEQSEAYRGAHAYWMARAAQLPAAPQLPMRSDMQARNAPRFSRRERRLDKARWESLKAAGRAKGITPPNLLLAAYGEVLARWSETPHFTINVTVSNRPPLHPDVNRLLGDFTSLIMHEADRRDPLMSFTRFARRQQQRFLEDLQHRQVSGLTVLREWNRQRGLSFGATMPVVFSCGLIGSGNEEVGNIEQFGAKVFSVSQTSQVWLHLFVAELNGQLIISWDAVDGVFEDGVLDAMFGGYCALLDGLCDDAALWDACDVVQLPPPMQALRLACNDNPGMLPDACLHAGFVARAQAGADAPAVIAPQRTLSYGQLLAESAQVADRLLANGLQPGQPVAVLMHKGWEQIVAVYGVLLAGGAYMPVDADLPLQRQLDLLRIGEVAQVLTQAGVANSAVADGPWTLLEIVAGTQANFSARHQQSLAAPLDQLAYIIFTSGTTGVPKGVMIDHRGAVNTAMHINRLLQVSAQDRVLAVSSLSFDLSVYDIFGVLAAGGALVMPDYRKGHDPQHWRSLISQHGVTLWNSAPQLMHMLMDDYQGQAEDAARLRTVLLSGDFIPLDLPARIRRRFAEAAVISLGGATEASIWSNYYPVHTVQPGWTSIPYGKPLPNQTIWVLDAALRPCPDHVVGRIHIGGLGLAQGYWRDAQKTAMRFITHPRSGERLYDTGDLGRYAADGQVLILGRDDGQVKIRGHRVELGEVETVICQHPSVRQAVVLTSDGRNGQKRLLAYVEGAVHEGLTQQLMSHLAARLPDYMLPAHLILLDALPLSGNGKVDYRALPDPAEDAEAGQLGRRLPGNALEQTLLEAWAHVIPDCELGVADNFFDLGGDSIMATQLVREINNALPEFRLEMHELFENLTIEDLAALYMGRQAAGPTSTVMLPDDAAMLADVDTLRMSLAGIDFRSASGGQRSSAPSAILLTGASGWIGAHLLVELLASTPASIYCLMRAPGPEAARTRLLDTLREYDLPVNQDWLARIEPVCGDLALPQLGLDETVWENLASKIDRIFHLGASLDVLRDYTQHCAVNVGSMLGILHLAAQHHQKAVIYCSPMAVCWRYRDGGVTLLPVEAAMADGQGLLTAYAQSKWAAEQALLAAAERGLPVRIYRSSHALPSSRSGKSKANDTYGAVLQAACLAGVIPDWPESRLHGVPVDKLARLIAEDARDAGLQPRHVCLENENPLSLTALLDILLTARPDALQPPGMVSRDEWQARCLEAAQQLPAASANLVQALFAQRAAGVAVQHMFSAHPASGVQQRAASLSNLTPPDYWRQVQRSARW